MVKNAHLFLFGVVILSAAVLIGGISYGCTDFQIKTTDGTVIIGRTMEFGMDVTSSIVVRPRGEMFDGTAPNGKEGMKWVSKYGFVAITAFGNENALIDGINEEGMSVEALWFPDAKYQSVSEADSNRAINVVAVPAWILSNFRSVDEIKEAIKKVRVWAEVAPELKREPPLHLACHDAEGKNIVIEFIEGQVKVYDNPIGVMTNLPSFDWHLTNLRNYINLDCWDAEPLTMRGVTLNPTGTGSGLRGIPGDWTPPSRFVRTAMLVHFASPVNSAAEGVNLAEHIVNAVDIPLGNVKAKQLGTLSQDSTQWALIKDLTNRVLYLRDYGNLSMRAIDLKRLPFDRGAKTRPIPVKSVDSGIVDITKELLQ